MAMASMIAAIEPDWYRNAEIESVSIAKIMAIIQP